MTAAQIAEECGRDDVERVKEILDDLWARGVILAQEKKDEPGVMKYVHLGMWGILTDLGVLGKDDVEGIASRKMVNDFNDEQGEREWTFSKYPWLRTLVVDKNIAADEKILTHELASEIIKANDTIELSVYYHYFNHPVIGETVSLYFVSEDTYFYDTTDDFGYANFTIKFNRTIPQGYNTFILSTVLYNNSIYFIYFFFLCIQCILWFCIYNRIIPKENRKQAHKAWRVKKGGRQWIKNSS